MSLVVARVQVRSQTLTDFIDGFERSLRILAHDLHEGPSDARTRVLRLSCWLRAHPIAARCASAGLMAQREVGHAKGLLVARSEVRQAPHSCA